MILYHGTSTEYLKTILAKGLLPRKRTGISNWTGNIESKPYLVYLTTAYPVYFALHATKEPHDLLILKVEVDEEDLLPDEDFLARVLRQQEKLDMPLEQINPHVDPRKNKHLTPECLQYNGIAATTKVLPNKILDHRIIKSENFSVIMSIGGDSMPIPVNYKILGKQYRKAMEALFDQGEQEAVNCMRDGFFKGHI